MTAARFRAIAAGYIRFFTILLLLLHPAAAQTTLHGGVTTDEPNEPPAATTAPPPPPPNLQPYLTDNGRFINRCQYWHDHPDADTIMYGQPDHFAPGQPIGNTEGYNGVPASYVRCAMDPCPPNGTICWRNPAAKNAVPPLQGQLQQMLQAKGCTIGPGNQVNCPDPHVDLGSTPGGYDACQNPVPPPRCHGQLQASAQQNKCHITPDGTGIACDTGGGGGHYNGGTTGGGTTGGGAPFGRIPQQAQAQTDCIDTPTPQTQAALRKTGNELLDTFAAMGSQADNTLNHFGKAVAAQINAILHPGETIAASYKAAVAFLADQDPNKLGKLRDKAFAGIAADPSGAIGDLGANAFTGELTGGVCSGVVGAGRNALRKTADVQRATGTLRQVVGDMQKAENAAGEVACETPPNIGRAGNPNDANPFRYNNNCVPATIAGIKKVLEGKPWSDVDIVTGAPNGEQIMDLLNQGRGLPGPMTWSLIEHYFGKFIPKGAGLARQFDQMFGVPTQMTQRAIEQELTQAGPGSAGMVFVKFEEDGIVKQHVFAAFNENGGIKFTDFQSGWDGTYNFNNILGSTFYRVK